MTPPAGLFHLHRRHLANVLILGGSTEQRMVAALSFHRSSPLQAGPFVCTDGIEQQDVLRAALQRWLSGGVPDSGDPLWTSRGGTLFVDSVTSLPADVQRLLLEFNRRRHDGAFSGRPWEGRLVTGDRHSLACAVRGGRFSPELEDELDKVRLALRPLDEGRDGRSMPATAVSALGLRG